MLEYDVALQRLLDQISVVCETETVVLDQAYGRVLAEGITSPINVPPKDNSAMDGYALSLGNMSLEDCWQVTATRLAGQANDISLAEREAARIMTGAEVPEGADTVIMQEDIDRVGDQITLKDLQHKVGENIRRAGDDIKQGSVLLEQGCCLDASHLGLLASVGLDRVTVYRKVKVALLSTGDELLEPGEPLTPGRIYNSNQFFLKPMIEQLGVEVVSVAKVVDDKAAIREAFIDASKQADFVITTGGVSVGDADFVKEILDEQGQIDFWKVAIKPGKPFACGPLNSAFLLGLPGNPVSALVTFMLLGRYALEKASGRPFKVLSMLPAVTAAALRKRPGRMDFQRASYRMNDQGQLVVTPFTSQSSGVLSSIAQSDCFIVLEKDQGRVEAGESVRILPFRQWL